MSFPLLIGLLLLRPREAWRVLVRRDAIPFDPHVLRLMFAALIPPLAHFVGQAVLGASISGANYLDPLFTRFAQMLGHYLLVLAWVYGLASIVHILGSRFRSVGTRRNAFKLMLYSAMPVMLGGIFMLTSMGFILMPLLGCYSIYLICIGLPILMKTAPGDTVSYTALTVGSTLLMTVLLAFLASLF